jgi:hypothetical protein
VGGGIGVEAGNPIIYCIGNEQLLNHPCKTAFLCSRRVPEAYTTMILRWANQLSAESDCVICGNHSPMERAVFKVLLRRRIPTVLALAETFTERSSDIEAALSQQTLLIVTHCEPSIHFATGRSAYDRNLLMIRLAQQIVVGYCTPNGNIEKQVFGRPNVHDLSATHHASLSNPSFFRGYQVFATVIKRWLTIR